MSSLSLNSPHELFLEGLSSGVAKQVQKEDDRNNLKQKEYLREDMHHFVISMIIFFASSKRHFVILFLCVCIIFLDLMLETIKQHKDSYLNYFTGHNPREMFFKFFLNRPKISLPNTINDIILTV